MGFFVSKYLQRACLCLLRRGQSQSGVLQKILLLISLLCFAETSAMHALAQEKNLSKPLLQLPGLAPFQVPAATPAPNTRRIVLDDQGEYSFCIEEAGDNQLQCLAALVRLSPAARRQVTQCDPKKNSVIGEKISCLEMLGSPEEDRSVQESILFYATLSEHLMTDGKIPEAEKNLAKMQAILESVKGIFATSKEAAAFLSELCATRASTENGTQCQKLGQENELEKKAIEACFSEPRPFSQIYRCLQIVSNVHFTPEILELCRKAAGLTSRGMRRQDACLGLLGSPTFTRSLKDELLAQIEDLKKSTTSGSGTFLNLSSKFKETVRGQKKILDSTNKDL